MLIRTTAEDLIFYQPLLQTYEWKRVGNRNLKVFILESRWRDSFNSENRLTEEEKNFVQTATVRFPATFDALKSNPFESFDLNLPAIGDKSGDTLCVDLDNFIVGRTKLINALCKERDCSTDDKTIRKTVWSSVYTNSELEEEAWVEAMLHESMIDHLMELFEDELKGFENARELVVVEGKRALKKHRDAILPILQESGETYKDMKSYKVFPENPELQKEFLHSKAIWKTGTNCGKVVKVFPEPNTSLRDVKSKFPASWGLGTVTS